MNALHRRLWIRSAIMCWVLAMLPACAASRGGSAESEEWQLTGSRIIACCCHSPCPCRINYKPTHRHGCDFTTAVHIDRGHIGGVPMNDMMWIVTGGVFGEKSRQNWTYIYISGAATDEQLAALEQFFEQSSAGMGEKAEHLGGNFLGMRRVPMQWDTSEGGRLWAATIPGVLEVRTRSIILPGHSRPVISTGIFDDFGDRFTHADCLVHTYDDPTLGHQWDLSGQQANQATFVLNPRRVGEGGIGWSCWSAHAALGDTRSEYQEAGGHR